MSFKTKISSELNMLPDENESPPENESATPEAVKPDDVPESTPPEPESEPIAEAATEEDAPAEPEAAEEKPSRHPGYDPVDLDDLGLPDEAREHLQARMDYLYGQAKSSKRESAEAIEYAKRLQETVDGIDTRVASFEERDQEDRITTLRKQIAEAQEEGDYERSTELLEELTDVKAEARLKAVRAEEDDPDEPTISNEAALTPSQERLIVEWATERGEDGQLLRPYVSEDHPDHLKAQNEAIRLAEDPIAMQRIESMDDFFTLLDKRMRPAPRAKAPEVMSGKTDANPAPAKGIVLSEDQKRVARKMGITEEKFAAQLAS